MPRTRGVTMAVAAALLLAACGGDGGADGDQQAQPTPTETETGTGTPEPQGSPVELEVEAEDFSFEQDTYTVAAGSTVELKFKNRDEGVPHTFSVYQDEQAQEEIFDTGNVIGDAEKEFEFQAPAAGTYFFRCDVHPEMNGDLVAE